MGGDETIIKTLAALLGRIGIMTGVGLIWFYRLLIAPLFPATCRFNPSCSAYGLEAVRRFGLIRGGWLSLCRIFRCHPWGDCGHDPVPQENEILTFNQLRRRRS